VTDVCSYEGRGMRGLGFGARNDIVRRIVHIYHIEEPALDVAAVRAGEWTKCESLADLLASVEHSHAEGHHHLLVSTPRNRIWLLLLK
jgi:hypothetical protein